MSLIIHLRGRLDIPTSKQQPLPLTARQRWEGSVIGASEQAILEELKRYEGWYARQSWMWGFWMSVCKGALILSSLTAIVMTAAVSKEYFEDLGRWLILASTLIASASNQILSQFKVREMEELRESGHIDIVELRQYAEQRFEELRGDYDKTSALKDEIRKKLYAIETNQHKVHADLNKDVARGKARV